MTLQQAVVLGLQASILLTVFGFGMQTTAHQMLYLMRQPGLLVRSMLAMFVVMPIIAAMLVWTFDLRPAFEIALVALAIAPVPPLLPRKEGKAGGQSAYGLGLMAAVSLLAIGIVPLSVEILGRFLAQPLHMPPGAVAKVVVVMTLLPLTAGVIVRTFAPALADRLNRPTTLIGTVLLVFGAGALLAGAMPVIVSLIDGKTLLAISAFVVAGVAVGHVLGGPEPENATVLALSTASRHPAIALAVAKVNFPNEPYLGATILLYLLVLTVITVPYVRLRRHVAGVTRSESTV